MMPQSMCLFFVMCMDSIPNFQAQQSLIGAVWTHRPCFWAPAQNKFSSEIRTGSGPSQGFPNKWSSRIKLSQGVPLEILRSNHAVSLAQIHHKMLHGHKNRARNPEYSRQDIRTKKTAGPSAGKRA